MIEFLVIGAGPTGLCAAKTLLQADPDAEVVLVEAHATIGGCWSREALYPTLKTNNLLGTVDFTDFPMDERFGIKPGQHCTGEAMHEYYTAYAEHFDLVRRVKFRTRVHEVRRCEGGEGWDVCVVTAPPEGTDAEAKQETLSCQKLIVATGVLSTPHMPNLKGMDDFDGLYLHSSQMGPMADDLVGNPDIKTVAVLGGSKSAYDAVYLAATTGHKVVWISRTSGRGMCWVFPTHTYLGPFLAFRERLVTRRIFSFMSPNVFPDFSGLGWLKSFLHKSFLGRKITQTFWKLIHADTLRDCEYRTHEKTKILEPEQSPFWYGTASGTLNYDQNFFSFVKSGQVQVYRADIDHVSSHCIHLSTGEELEADALVVATGYNGKPTVPFSQTNLHSDLGLPTTSFDDAQRSLWSDLDAEADTAIGAQFPRLLKGPFVNPASNKPKPFNPGMTAEVPYTPWRLYRGIAPPGLATAGDRSLVFLGMFSNVANTLRLEVQCLWALAYLQGKLPSVDRDTKDRRIFAETALFQRFTELRAPYGHGRCYPDLVFDQLPYWDTLLNDLGVQTKRKPTVFKELFAPYTQDDYRGMVDEWLSKQKKD